MLKLSFFIKTPLTYASSGVVVMLILTLVLWNGLQRFEEHELSAQVETETLWLGKQLEDTLKMRASSIDRMADRWEYGGGTARALWTKDATGHLRLGNQAIEWADTEGRVRWVVPEAGNEAAIGFDLTQDATRKKLLEQARGASSTIYSSQMDFIQGGQGMLLVRALSVAGRFDGYLISVINTDHLFAGLSKEVAARGYSLDVSRDGVPLYRRGELPDAATTGLVRSYSLNVPAGNWQLRLWPSQSARHPILPALGLTSGLALTFLVGIAFWFWGLSLQRARQVEQVNRTLHEVDLQNQAILDNMVDGVITIDERGIITSFNRAAEHIFGYAAAEVTGKNVSLLMPEPDRSRHDGYMHNYHTTGKARIIGIGREVHGQRKDGSVFPMDLAISEIGRAGKPLYIGLTRDITSRKQSEEALIAAKEEAEQASMAKSQFISSMSHELRTPLNSVLGFAQLMEMDASLPEEHKASVDAILKSGHHLLELIGQVLNLAKIEAGNQDISIEPVGCAELVEECVDMVGTLAQMRGIRIESDIAARMMVRADRMRLKQVLINLLSNAIKYNRPEGMVRVHAAITDAGWARLMVTDTGQGIPADRMGELFQAFNRLSAEGGNIAGAGIGLAISRRLMEIMGGKIGADSEPGAGSTFWIELPLVEIGA